MSDYLDNLLARTTGPKEMVQPRPISLFEPLPGPAPMPAPGPGADEADLGETVLPTLDVTRAAGQPARQEPRWPGPGVAPARPGILPARAGRPAEPQPAARWTQRPGGPQPEPPGTRPGPAPAPPASPGQSRTVLQPQPGPADSTPAEGSAPHPAAAGLAQPTLEPAVAHAAVERTVQPPSQGVPAAGQAGSLRELLEAESHAAQPEPAGPLPVVARPQRAAYDEPPPPAAAPPAAQPQATIQVTIGRIEVRATPAASPPRKQTSAPPMLSLEGYLRQRRGGAR